MPDENTPNVPAVSPTGQPRVPTTWVPYINGAMGLAIAAGIVIGASPLPAWVLAIPGAIFTAGLWLLGNGPGLRKLSVVMLVAGLSLTSLTGCTVIKRIGRTTELAAPKVLDCVGDACKDDFPVLMGIAAKELMAVVAGGSFDVEPVIDNLLTTAKDPGLMACVIREVLKAWEQAGTGAGIPLPEGPENQRLLFVAAHVGQTHLLAKGYLTK